MDQAKWDFDTLASLMDDPSFTYDNMRQYYLKVEKNLWLNETIGKPVRTCMLMVSSSLLTITLG